MRRMAGIGIGLAAVMLSACGDGGEAPASVSGTQTAAAASGEREFRACAICHATAPRGTREGDVRLIGPNLHGIVGEQAAHLPDFAYSPALKNSGLVWDEATLDAFIENPQRLVRGNRMAYVGEADPAKRKAIIEYLKTLK